jgi:hypothetical protein
VCGDPCGVFLTLEIKKKHSTGLGDRLREGKGWKNLAFVVSVFRTRGSLDRRVNLSLRAPAQMGWREMEHKGENAARIISHQGGVLVVGVTSVHERERESEPVR